MGCIGTAAAQRIQCRAASSFAVSVVRKQNSDEHEVATDSSGCAKVHRSATSRDPINCIFFAATRGYQTTFCKSRCFTRVKACKKQRAAIRVGALRSAHRSEIRYAALCFAPAHRGIMNVLKPFDVLSRVAIRARAVAAAGTCARLSG